jgi:hypothetical protein
MGLVFDKVYFPHVYFPTGGFDARELNKEIERLRGLQPGRNTSTLISLLRFIEHAKTLSGFCEFTGTRGQPFGAEQDDAGKLVNELHEAMHGPNPPNWTPYFETNFTKGLPGGDEYIAYPGDYHYLAGSVLEAAKTGKHLLVDVPGLPVPGLDSGSAENDASALTAILAIHCTKLVLPVMAVLSPSQLMEFRHENETPLRHFRRAMLRYAGELNASIAGLDASQLEGKTKFFVETNILPELDELRESLTASSRSWSERLKEGGQIVGELLPCALSPTPRSAALAVLLNKLPGFIGNEIAARGDAKNKRRLSDLYYLLQVERAVVPKA